MKINVKCVGHENMSREVDFSAIEIEFPDVHGAVQHMKLDKFILNILERLERAENRFKFILEQLSSEN